MNKKVLIISNEPLSNSTSNGRTLRNFLLNIPKEQIAQFYIHGTPDTTVCSNYYQVSDRDALNALLLKKKAVKANAEGDAKPGGESKKVTKNCKTMLIRDIVWRTYRWWRKDFTAFIENFAPDIILLQAGDAPFMFAIALKIAHRYKIPLIMYNSEEYVLKDKMYNSAFKYPVAHKLLQRRLQKIYKKFMKTVSFCVYSTEYLEEKYQQKYPHIDKSCALYTVSELEPLIDKSDRKHFNLLYCGNLGVGRVEPLDELARVLYEIDSSATLDIYGSFPDAESEEKLCANPNVCYGGVVPYDQVPELMSRASMLVHCENKDRLENLRGAFSTKIADSLASSRPFLVYATREYPFVQYLEKYDCAHIAENEAELASVLRLCIEDELYRKKYLENARALAQNNHSVVVNAEKMKAIIENG